MTKLRMLCPVLVLLLCTVSFEFGAPVQGNAVEGVVVQTGTGAAVPGATVTLSTGPIDSISSEALRVAAGVAGVGIPPAQPRPPAAIQQPGQPVQPPAQPAAPPPPPVAEEVYLLSLSDAALVRGISPGSPELVSALHNFREQTAKFTAYTESDGRFSLRDVPPGQYTVRAERDGFFSTGGAVATITVPGTPAPIRLSMIPGAVIAGRLRDEDGEFLANATVQAFTITYQNGFPTLSPSVTTKTNFRGDYRLYWMPAGDYIVAANRDASMTLGARSFYPGTPELSSSKSISLKTGETIEGVDFTMAEGRLVKVAGEVISSAPPPSIQSLNLPANIQLPPNFSLPNNAQLILYSRDPNAPDSSQRIPLSVRFSWALPIAVPSNSPFLPEHTTWLQ